MFSRSTIAFMAFAALVGVASAVHLGVQPRQHPFSRTRVPVSEANVQAQYSSCSKHGCDSGTSWDFLLFVNNWPQATCDTSSRQCAIPSDVDYFTIHGLWPSNNDTTYPCCCNNNYFNPANISDIIPQLEDYWTDVFADDGDNFWEHEWNKHGTCAMNIYSGELEFFTAALKLRQTWDFNKILNDAGKYPDSSTKLYIDDIQSIIGNATQATPVVFCTHDNELQSIGICVDNNLTPFQCDDRIYKADYQKCSESYTYWKPIKRD